MLRLTTIINKMPIWLGIFLLLCLHFLSGYMNGNEEAYLLIAKQFYDPSFIADSFTLNQFPSNRLLYQYLAGFLLEHLSFEHTSILGRVVLCFLFAFPLAKIIELFKLSLIESTFILIVFFFSSQAFFAGSWMFLGFEAKCISYLFVLWAMCFLLENKLNISVLFLALATWFHVLVGGWTFIIVFIYMIFQKNSLRLLFTRGLIYTILIAPLLWYLSQEILINSETVINGVNIDWVYTHFRSSHHTNPGLFLPGALMISIWGVVSLLFFTKLEQPVLNRINILNLVTIGLLLLSFGIAWFDENGAFTKFYPFRPNTLLKLFIIFEVAMVLKLWVVQINFLPYINAALLFFLIPLFIQPTQRILKLQNPPNQGTLLWNDFTNHIQQNTPKDAVFISHMGHPNQFADGPLSFNRKTRRNRFVIYKFVPGGGNQIYEWYMRVQERKKLVTNLDYLNTLNKKYRLDYVFSAKRLTHDNLKLKYHNDRYFLYKIKE